ncbi:MAG TPA: hypothetical protein VLJ88_05660 [Propionibacteriaceae bacterium]|nr:hypothetical protein [Propionibacteriaceae bacterium]
MGRAGLSTKVLRGRRFTSPHRGVHLLATGNGDLRVAVDAARLGLPPGTLATGVTGLRLHGVEVGNLEPLHFVTTHPGPIRRPGLRVTRVSVLPEACNEVVAIPEHCWLVAALDLNLLDLVTAADWMLRLRLLNLRTLESYVATSRSRGAGTARHAVGLARERVDSPRETWLRLCLVLAGLPTPDCNPTIRGDGVASRVDLVYPGFRILIEYEGDHHRLDRDQWNRDIERQEGFARNQWALLRITSARARQPRWVVGRVYAMLQNAGYGGPPPIFDARWRELFE